MSRLPHARWSVDAKRVLVLAQEEADRRRSGYIGTEHLLLAMLRLGNGSAFRALLYLNVDEPTVRRMLAGMAGGSGTTPAVPTKRVQRVVEIAYAEAERMGSASIRSGHLLMGLAGEGEGTGAAVLRELVGDVTLVVTAAERQMT